MNPEGSYGIYNPGVAMIPPPRDLATGALLPGLPIAAGGIPGPLRGLPNMILTTDAKGALALDPPFLPGSGTAPDVADARSWLGPLPNGAAATRIAVLPNLQAQDPSGQSYQTTLTTYDQSEQRAWYSGEALKNLMKTLNDKHQNSVRVIAHSMGNVVTGSALKLATGPILHTYIAAQAALSARYWDNADSNIRTDWSAGGIYGIKTPDITGHYFYGKTGPPFLKSSLDMVKDHRLFNYNNARDYALDKWIINNKTKPDHDDGYKYEDHDGDPDTYNPDPINPSQGDLFRSYVSFLTLPKDQFEIFARCAQSRSWALGASTDVQGFTGVDLQGLFEFDDKHYSHSREFRSNLPKERRFWIWVGSDFGLQGFDKSMR